MYFAVWENFDKMRIKKEKEILKCKDTIQLLQHELKILKVEVKEVKKLEVENEKLHLTLDEIKLQNAGDIQRLRAEMESLKTKENISLSSAMSEKRVSSTPNEKAKELKQEVMEPDSSDEVTIIDEEKKHTSVMHKKISKAINKKVMNQHIHLSTPLAHLEKRKRAWESESSGSECLEITFDKNAKKIAGVTPKVKSPSALNRTPIISSGKFTLSHEKRRDLLEITDMEINFTNTSSREQNEIKRTPTTPTDRRFFKTPLKEREYSFKRPQLQKLWF